MLSQRALSVAILVAALVAPISAVKLKFKDTECVSYTFNQYEYFYGSFVSLPDVYGVTVKYDLHVTAPSGTKLYELLGESEATFHLVPVESGAHRFCLKVNYEKSGTHYSVPRELLWNINVGYSEGHDKIEETDTQYLWHHVYQIDGQVQELKSTLQFLWVPRPCAAHGPQAAWGLMPTLCGLPHATCSPPTCWRNGTGIATTLPPGHLAPHLPPPPITHRYWREKRHRATIESTQRRTVFYALLRNVVLISAAVVNVVIVQRMFNKPGAGRGLAF